jgi:hypothetical protein
MTFDNLVAALGLVRGKKSLPGVRGQGGHKQIAEDEDAIKYALPVIDFYPSGS